MTSRSRPKAVVLVNVDFFFVSHRLPLGEALRDAGFEVIVAAGETNARRAIEAAGLRFEALPISRSGRSPVSEAKTMLSILRLYLREKPDVVHQVTIKPILYGSAAAQVARVPAIINEVSGLGFVFTDRNDAGAAAPKWKQTARGLARATYGKMLGAPRSRAIFQNRDDRQTFVAGGFVKSENATLVRGAGVDIRRFQATPLPSGAPVFVLASRMLWDKGIGEFVEAARILRRRGVEARCVLVGPLDPDNPAAAPEADIRAFEDEGIVEWWGPKTPAEMPEVLARAHAVVLPSYREGMPLVLAEAAASGRACIATDVPGCREIARDGVNGWLVPVRQAAGLAEAMIEAAQDRAELEARGARGRKLAEDEFALDRILRRTFDVYRELLGDRFPSRGAEPEPAGGMVASPR
jgi:glycosyltransferase involved in cell wall biosynthesis